MKQKAERNRSLTCYSDEIERLSADIFQLTCSVSVEEIEGKIIRGDIFELAKNLPKRFVDLLILDPPYNLSKNYNGHLFREKDKREYQFWFNKTLEILLPTLKSTATVYACSDWKTSIIISPILESYFYIRNRITWEREKGRGANANWKNNIEDIWFCTVSNNYQFNVNAVKLKKKVIAPYKINGKPKDWSEEESGNYRLTYPSNLWTDISIPFWSMPENTKHPTQKPEKLIANLILASSKAGDFVFDPFLGSGTAAVVAHKLKRRFCGIELNKEYCCLALKRIELSAENKNIQGYADGVFWERNSLNIQAKTTKLKNKQNSLLR